MVFYKKHTGVECIDYRQALEEALCFGWIDSLIKKLDEDRYVRKFTPRTNHQKWSDINLKIVATLIRQGRMTDEGLRKIDLSSVSFAEKQPVKETPSKVKKELLIPEFIQNEYAQNEPALHNFNNLPASCKKQYVRWITYAKREETIRKRLIESIAMLKENKRLGLK